MLLKSNPTLFNTRESFPSTVVFQELLKYFQAFEFFAIKKVIFSNTLISDKTFLIHIYYHILILYFEVPAILQEAIPATIQSVENEIKKVTDKAFLYTGIEKMTCFFFFLTQIQVLIEIIIT